ncbi:MAG TPA: CAP domain-containing protein, partial [Blastocatellia bacterium]|nr:CAP domain-containing protein [Blastocatellia bacterium]
MISLKLRLSLLAVAAILSLTFQSALAQTPTLDAEELAFLTQINNYRAANGLGQLKVSIALTNASKWMSGDMAAKNYFSHTDSLNRDPFTRMSSFGYSYNTWKAENIAAGYSDGVNTFNQWKNSPGHNTNMLNPNFTVIGIGRVYNSSSTYRYYWTTNFGGYVDATLNTGGSNPQAGALTTVDAGSYGYTVAPDGIA